MRANPAAKAIYTSAKLHLRRVSEDQRGELRRKNLYIKPKSTQFWESNCDQWRAGAQRLEGKHFSEFDPNGGK
jgi:hypothetical protein